LVETFNTLEQGAPNFFVRGPQKLLHNSSSGTSYVMRLFQDMLHSTKSMNFL